MNKIMISMWPVAALLAGCVSTSEHDKLKEQFTEQEAYAKKHRNEVQSARRETTQVGLAVHEKELEIERLQEANKNLNDKVGKASAAKPNPAPMTPTVVPASVPRSMAEKSRPLPAGRPISGLEGLKINEHTNGIILDQEALFVPGSARLKKEGIAVIKKIAQRLNSPALAHSKVRVEGHTDNTPITRSKVVKDNWQLSGMRAQVVLSALEAQGVKASRLSFAGYSYHKPIATDRSAAAQAKNRRVEIVVIQD